MTPITILEIAFSEMQQARLKNFENAHRASTSSTEARISWDMTHAVQQREYVLERKKCGDALHCALDEWG